jgi:hypothetical protein
MSCFETEGHARGGLPARRPTTGGVVWRGGIQAKTGDHGESVTASSVHRDPFTPSATTVGAQIVRAQRGADKAGSGQSIGNGAGAVIATVIEGAMAAAVSIWFCAQLIRCPDRTLHRERGVRRRQRQSATKPCLVSGSRWSRRRKRTGSAGLRQEHNHRGAKNRLSNRNSHEVFKSAFAMPRSVSKSHHKVSHEFFAMH